VAGLVLLDQRQQQRLVFEQVHLVEDQHDGRAGLADQVRGALVLDAEGRRRIHQEEQQVALLQRIAHGVHEALVELRIGAVNPGSIDEYDLRAIERQHALYGGAGGLGLVGDDGHFLPHQGVQQRGFAGVGTPHQRDESRLEMFFHKATVCDLPIRTCSTR
jgi:hypothetical protein